MAGSVWIDLGQTRLRLHSQSPILPGVTQLRFGHSNKLLHSQKAMVDFTSKPWAHGLGNEFLGEIATCRD